MHGQRKRAIKWALVALVLGVLSIAGRIWLDNNGALERPELGVVGEFVLRDASDNPLTRDQLRRSLTLIIHWPAVCAAADSCTFARTNAAEVRSWVERSLTANWGEDHNPLVKIVVGEGAAGIFTGSDWRLFPIAPGDGTILPTATDQSKPWLVVVDNNLQFAVQQELNQPVNLRGLERVLSKTAFDQYLGNYLSKRTFMGPKRTQN